MRWKVFICLLLPLAALVGTWLGFEVAGISYSPTQSALLVLFGCWTVFGFGVYFSSERAKMNRSRGYR